jgi:hypothetical protein
MCSYIKYIYKKGFKKKKLIKIFLFSTQFLVSNWQNKMEESKCHCPLELGRKGTLVAI